MLDRVLETAEDLVVLDSRNCYKVKFAFPFKGEVARHYFDKTLANPDERDVEGFKGCWKYDSKTELIHGSSVFLTLRLDKVVRKEDLWIPTLEEARLLDKKGKLSNGVYRDFGVVVYSQGEPNQRVAKEIRSQTKRKFPLIVPFSALDYRVDSEFPNGVAVFLSDNQDEIKSGKKAQEIFSNCYTRDSGACRVSQDRDGDWGAGWLGLDGSGGDGRVDWMCGEATRSDLEYFSLKDVDKTVQGRLMILIKEREMPNNKQLK